MTDESATIMPAHMVAAGAPPFAHYDTPPEDPGLPARDAIPERVMMLHRAAKLTAGERDAEYGPPAMNMGCAGELKLVFRKYLARPISPAEQEALDMTMTKLSRLACGKPKLDTYVDLAGYIAIAGECSGAAA